MANPRRSSYSITINNQGSSENNNQFQTQTQSTISSLKFFLKKPHAFPFLLSIFLLLTWVSLRLQYSAHVSSSSSSQLNSQQWSSSEDDRRANLVRFASGFPSLITKDKRGWLLNPVSVAADAGISGGAVMCASVHLGEIRPHGLRGNHRHHTCNETFLIWGARTIFRVESNEEEGKGYAEVTIGADEVAVATSPAGMAHALINIDTPFSSLVLHFPGVRQIFWWWSGRAISSYCSTSSSGLLFMLLPVLFRLPSSCFGVAVLLSIDD